MQKCGTIAASIHVWLVLLMVCFTKTQHFSLRYLWTWNSHFSSSLLERCKCRWQTLGNLFYVEENAHNEGYSQVKYRLAAVLAPGNSRQINIAFYCSSNIYEWYCNIYNNRLYFTTWSNGEVEKKSCLETSFKIHKRHLNRHLLQYTYLCLVGHQRHR